MRVLSDFSLDDLFDFDDDDELKVKLKFKAKREASFKNAQGEEFAHLKVKVASTHDDGLLLTIEAGER